ncbi:MAG: hypothetical protein AAFV53_00355 [Myxococcota bacterium]
MNVHDPVIRSLLEHVQRLQKDKQRLQQRISDLEMELAGRPEPALPLFDRWLRVKQSMEAS